MSINDFVEMAIFLCLIRFFRFIPKYKVSKMNVAGKLFWQKLDSKLCRYPVGQKFCRNRSSLLSFQDKYVFAFYTEIQDGRQKWLGNDFGENLPVDSEDTLRVKNLIKIALACTVSEMNAFWRFMQKFKLAAKSGWETILAKTCQ